MSDRAIASGLTSDRLSAPPTGRSIGRRLRTALAFAGPAFLVSLGYMDPGNWGTDLAAGSRFSYDLLWVLVASNLTAIFLQHLSAKLGIATGDHLAGLLGRQLGRRWRVLYWGVAETAMLATETAEFLGVVVALRLLFGLSLPLAVIVGAALVLGLVASASSNARRIEWAIFALLAVVGAAYVLEVVLARPALVPIVAGAAIPKLPSGSLLVAVAILGATVMPHNLFLHSGLILTRRDVGPPARLLRHADRETLVALNLALFVNAAILTMSAATFAPKGIVVESLGQAHETLEPLLGSLASGAFALALLAAGLASATTGSMAGQLVLDGLIGWRVPLVVRRAATMVPAVIVLAVGLGEVAVLVWSQVVLSLALPAVAAPLVVFTGRRQLMGELTNRPLTHRAGLLVVAALTALNLVLLAELLV